MAEASGSEVDRTLLRTQPPEVLRMIGPRIEAAFEQKVRNSGQLFPIEEQDFSGRDTVRYFGDIREAFRESTLPAVPIKIAETVWHRGLPYLKSDLPAWVRAERALMEIGSRPERGAPVGDIG